MNGRVNNGRNKKGKAAGDVDRRVGKRVRLLRLQLGLSQEDVAKEVDLSFQQIQKYEKGTNRLSVSRMLQFCAILRCTPNDIVGWSSKVEGINEISVPAFMAARDLVDLPEELVATLRKMCDLLLPYAARKKK